MTEQETILLNEMVAQGHNKALIVELLEVDGTKFCGKCFKIVLASAYGHVACIRCETGGRRTIDERKSERQ